MDKTLTLFALGVVVVVALFFGLTLKGVTPAESVEASGAAQGSVDHPLPAAAPSATAFAPPPSLKGTVALPEPRGASATPAHTTATYTTSEPLTLPQLRDLSTSSPLLALRLAREDNERDPKGSDAPGRAWVIVKSLTNLRQFDEAREEARQMVRVYPNHPDTLDVERHVLSQPSSPTSEPRD